MQHRPDQGGEADSCAQARAGEGPSNISSKEALSEGEKKRGKNPLWSPRIRKVVSQLTSIGAIGKGGEKKKDREKEIERAQTILARQVWGRVL